MLRYKRMLRHKQLSQTVQKQPSGNIHFQKFIQKIPVVEFFFWSNYRLTVQSSDNVLKLLYQESSESFQSA